MAKEKDEDLQDPNQWDWDNAEVVEPKKPARAIVSVPFQRDDFQVVAARAREMGQSTSAFIRAAALEKASRSSEVVVSIEWAGTTGGSFYSTALPASITRAPSVIQEIREHVVS